MEKAVETGKAAPPPVRSGGVGAGEQRSAPGPGSSETGRTVRGEKKSDAAQKLTPAQSQKLQREAAGERDTAHNKAGEKKTEEQGTPPQ